MVPLALLALEIVLTLHPAAATTVTTTTTTTTAVATTLLSRMTTHVRMSASTSGSESGPHPSGYTLDACTRNADCLEKRRCVRGDLITACRATRGSVPVQCLCMPKFVQNCGCGTRCYMNPYEACLVAPRTKDQRGVCASVGTVRERILIRLDCKKRSRALA